VEISIPVREALGAMPDWAHQFDLTSRLLYPLLFSQSARCHRHAVLAALTSIISRPPISSCTVPAFSLFFHLVASATPFFVIGCFPISFSFSISRALTAGAAPPQARRRAGLSTPRPSSRRACRGLPFPPQPDCDLVRRIHNGEPTTHVF